MSSPWPRPNWTGALLVGGRSRRMGTDKLLLRLPDGARLMERPGAALRAVCGACLQVGGGTAHALADFTPLADAPQAEGPLAGLLAALYAARTAWVLVLAGDLPAVDAAFLAALQDEAERDPARALLPQSAAGLQPLCAAYPRALAARIAAAAAAGERAVHAALPLEARRAWPYEEAAAAARIADPFRNINRPSDWEAYLGPNETT